MVSYETKIVNEYDQEIPQSLPQTTMWHREAEPPNHHETSGRQIKQSNQLSLPIKMIAILERTQNNVQQNIEQLQTPTMGVTINKKSTTIMKFVEIVMISVSNLAPALAILGVIIF